MIYRSVMWNLAGSGLPLLAGVYAIPKLVSAIGVERFSVLTLAWVLVGYFSLFDFGLGRALTSMLAQRRGTGAGGDIRRLVPTALTLMNGLAAIGAVLLAMLSFPATSTWLSMPWDMRNEALTAFLLLAATVPFVISAAGLRGILEAYQRFDWVNWVRLPLGISNFLAPLAVVGYSKSLIPLVSVLALTRILCWLAYYFFCGRILPGISLLRPEIHRQWLSPLLRFGGWLTVSNLIGPLMTYLDRFLVGGLVSLTAVAYYATPYELVSRLLIIVGAVTAVLLPSMALALTHRGQEASSLYRRALCEVYFASLPPVAAVALFAKEGLGWWLGDAFALQSTYVLQCLALAILANSVAQVSLSVLHAAGRADWPAKLHLLELPIYLLALLFLARIYGINGVATAWLARAAVDAVAMYILSLRVVQLPIGAIIMQVTTFLLLFPLVAGGSQIDSQLIRTVSLIMFSLISLIGFRRHLGTRLQESFRAH